ncbi:probable beta-1,3-galactosyltransferase 2 [Vicia villosa]|uniref:probable beta-1,3-galactosyltransferase 2 n=1 Tax=Vicia villosa TaxID=3911 RepID=UPI00273B422F|nr:probable beta-1,3-galactosyltransferase 2 [Vicia villosa]
MVLTIAIMLISLPAIWSKLVIIGIFIAGGVRYHEPEHWKFGESGNKYFRHATGQLYAISNDLATYISNNHNVLHKYANEDVSIGAWFIGLDVEHIDDRRLCCGTPPDCEWKAQAGNICVASFDWSCSGICRSADRIKEVHRRCGEGENALLGVHDYIV